MTTAYHSMALRFHHDNNIGLDTSKMMAMINEAKDGLEDTLFTNDTIKEDECVQAAEDAISISSDEQAMHHPNQLHHLIKHQYYQLNTLMIMKKRP